MSTETLTLTDFLLARIAEDEAGARAARFAADWPKVANAAASGANADAGLHVLFAGSPNRVLAECEAKRRIVELHEGVWKTWAPQFDLKATGCSACVMTKDQAADDWPCDTILTLALPYADHPDFREEWDPR